RRHTRSKRDWSSDVCSSDLWFVNKMIGSKFKSPFGCWLKRMRHIMHLSKCNPEHVCIVRIDFWAFPFRIGEHYAVTYSFWRIDVTYIFVIQPFNRVRDG